MARIRPATVDDAGLIHAMVLGIAEHTDSVADVASSVDDIARYGFGADPAFAVLIAEDDQRVAIGMSLYFRSFSTWRGRPGGYIQDFFVAPQARGTATARQLLAATAARVHAAGGTYLRLSVEAANELAQRFYRNGMVWSSDERLFKLDGEPFRQLAGEGEEL